MRDHFSLFDNALSEFEQNKDKNTLKTEHIKCNHLSEVSCYELK